VALVPTRPCNWWRNPGRSLTALLRSGRWHRQAACALLPRGPSCPARKRRPYRSHQLGGAGDHLYWPSAQPIGQIWLPGRAGHPVGLWTATSECLVRDSISVNCSPTGTAGPPGPCARCPGRYPRTCPGRDRHTIGGGAARSRFTAAVEEHANFAAPDQSGVVQRRDERPLLSLVGQARTYLAPSLRRRAQRTAGLTHGGPFHTGSTDVLRRSKGLVPERGGAGCHLG